MADAIFRIRSQLESNADSYVRDLLGGLQRIQNAARAPQGVSGQLGAFQARETVALRGAQQRGIISNADYQAGLRALDLSIDQARRDISARLSRTLGRQVNVSAPSSAQLERSVGAEYRRQGLDPTRAAGQTSAALRDLQRRTDATERLARAQQRLTQMGIPPGSPLPPSVRALASGGPSPDELRRLMQSPDYGRTTNVLGQQSALQRRLGLDIGVQQRQYEVDQAQQGGPFSPVATRGVLAALDRYLRTLETAAAEGQIFNQLSRSANQDLYQATRELAELRQRNRLIEAQARREGTAGQIDDIAADRLARERRERDVRGRVVAGRTPADVDATGVLSAEQRAQQAQTRRRAAQATALDPRLLSARAEERAAQALLNRSINRRARANLSNLPVELQGTRIQRFQARLASRSGGPPRLPTDFQTGGQIFGSRFATTAGFAASGALLYGGTALVGDILRESTELQQELGLVRSQMEQISELGNQPGGGALFERYKEQLREVSLDAGVAISDAAEITGQLAGSFADDEGVPDFRRAIVEGRSALRLKQITGLDQQELNDELTAISLSFDQSFESIGDNIAGLRREFGVTEPELVSFTARLAPLGAELGFTAEQLTALGAAAQQSSGISGAVLAEQFGRILPALQDKRAELLELLRSNPATEGAAEGVRQGFIEGNIPDVLRELVGAYDSLSKSQQNQLASLVGGRREAAAFYAILERGGATIRALDATEGDYAGEFDKRWAEHTETLQYSLDQMRRSAEELGQQIFEQGLGDALTFLADVGGQVVQVTTGLVEGFDALNDALGGIPAKVLAIAVAYRALQAAGRFGAGRLGIQGPGLALAGLTQPGGFLSPYQGYQANTPGLGVLPLNQVPLTARPGGNLPGFRQLSAAGGGRAAFAGLGLSVGSAAAGLIAPIAIGFALQQVAQFEASLEGVRTKVDEQAQRLFEEGLSREQVQTRLRASQPDDRSWLGGLPDRVTSEFSDNMRPGSIALNFVPGLGLGRGIRSGYRALFGDDPRGDAYDEQIQQILEANQGEELLTQFAEANEEEMESLIDAIFEARRDRGSAAAFQARESLDLDADATRGEIDSAIQARIDAVAQDPTNKEAVDALNLLIAGFTPDQRADIERRIAEVQEEVEAGDRFQSKQQDVELIRALVEAGDVGRAQLILALTRQVELATQNAEDYPENVEYQQAEAAAKAALAEAKAAPVLEAAEFRDKIGEFTGQTPEDAVRAAEQDLANVQDAPLTTQVEAANRLVAAKQALLEQMIAAAGDDKAAIAALNTEGLDLAPQATAALVRGQLNIGNIAEVIGSIAEEDGMPIGLLMQLYSSIITTEGEVTEEIRDRFRERVAQLHQMLTLARHFGSSSDIAYLEDEIGRTESALAALDQVQVPGDVLGDTSDTAQQWVDVARQQIQNRLARAQALANGNPVDQARAELRAAEQMLDTARTDQEEEEFGTALIQAQNALGRAAREQGLRIRESARAIARARADGDPLALASLDIQAALDELNNADPNDPAAANLARARLIEAQNSQRRASEDIEQARLSYLAATAEGDPIRQANLRAQAAAQAVATARAGSAAWYSAKEQLITAQRAIGDAILDAMVAQRELAGAIYEAAGDTVSVARVDAEIAQVRLQDALRRGTQGAELDRVRAAAVQAQTNLTTTQRQDRLGDLEYLYEFDKITAGRYIEMLESELRRIPESNKEARREIERRIKSVREELGRDYQFNLPTNLALPTAYEARRLDQLGGGVGYQDNRTISIEVYPTPGMDEEGLARSVADHVGDRIAGPPVRAPGRIY